MALLATACGASEDSTADIAASSSDTVSPTPDVSTASPAEPSPAPKPAVASTIPSCADLTREPPVDGPISDDDEVAQAQRARAELGFPSDIATVQNVLATTGPDYSLPAPHTPEEFTEIFGRKDTGLPQAQAYGASEALDQLAGVWLDQSAGGIPVIAFTGDLDRHRAALAERGAEGVLVVEATWTEAELRATQDAAGSFAMEHDLPISFSSVDIIGNHVELGLIAPTPEQLATLEDVPGREQVCLAIEQIPGPDDATPASWWPDDGADLSPTATTIDIEVIALACAGGRSAEGRIVDPVIEYRADAVVVTVSVIPLPGPQDCPSNPPAPYQLVLDEPLGDRALLDGGVDPPAAPQVQQ